MNFFRVLNRFLDREATPEEREYLEKCIASDPHLKEQFELSYQIKQTLRSFADSFSFAASGHNPFSTLQNNRRVSEKIATKPLLLLLSLCLYFAFLYSVDISISPFASRTVQHTLLPFNNEIGDYIPEKTLQFIGDAGRKNQSKGRTLDGEDHRPSVSLLQNTNNDEKKLTASTLHYATVSSARGMGIEEGQTLSLFSQRVITEGTSELPFAHKSLQREGFPVTLALDILIPLNIHEVNRNNQLLAGVEATVMYKLNTRSSIGVGIGYHSFRYAFENHLVQQKAAGNNRKEESGAGGKIRTFAGAQNIPQPVEPAPQFSPGKVIESIPVSVTNSQLWGALYYSHTLLQTETVGLLLRFGIGGSTEGIIASARCFATLQILPFGQCSIGLEHRRIQQKISVLPNSVQNHWIKQYTGYIGLSFDLR